MDKPTPLHDPRFFSYSVLSPLRYPGAKRQLAPVIESIVSGNVPPPRLLVEPFCGGATASLRLAGSGAAEHIILADADPLVADFWYVAAFDTGWLVNNMLDMEVTVERWDWWRMFEPKSRRDRALKCLFLNRTTFSGILHGRAGPIGGRKQTSENAIGCRFGRPGLERRLRAVGDLANTGRLLDVWHSTWQDTLARLDREYSHLDSNEVAVYLDPPYVDKAKFLYDWSFDSDQHKDLANAVTNATTFRWLLSYDDNVTVRDLYPSSDFYTRLVVPLHYTTAGFAARSTKDELLVTNYPDIPEGLLDVDRQSLSVAPGTK